MHLKFKWGLSKMWSATPLTKAGWTPSVTIWGKTLGIAVYCNLYFNKITFWVNTNEFTTNYVFKDLSINIWEYNC